MGTYFALADQITALAERLDQKGKLQQLFQKAHARVEPIKENGIKVKESTREEREDKSGSNSSR